MTQEELEVFVDSCIPPLYEAEPQRNTDSCPIDFKGEQNGNE